MTKWGNIFFPGYSDPNDSLKPKINNISVVEFLCRCLTLCRAEYLGAKELMLRLIPFLGMVILMEAQGGSLSGNVRVQADLQVSGSLPEPFKTPSRGVPREVKPKSEFKKLQPMQNIESKILEGIPVKEHPMDTMDYFDIEKEVKPKPVVFKTLHPIQDIILPEKRARQQ